MRERRVFERRETTYHAEVCEAATGRVVGLLADISGGGMMLRTEQPLDRGATMLLEVEIAGLDEVVALEAAVCWCEPDLDPATHVVGLEFCGPTPPGSTVVEEIRRRLGQGQ